MSATLRLAASSDAEAVLAIYAPVVRDSIISFELEPPTAAEMAERIRATLVQLPWLLLEEEQRLLGYAYASPHRSRLAYQWAVDVSVYVAEPMQGRGYGRRLYGALLAILRAQGYFSALAGIALPNAASVGLHEAMGFERIGVFRNIGYKLGAWRDVGWWGLTLQPHSHAPRPPRALPDLHASGELAPLLADSATQY